MSFRRPPLVLWRYIGLEVLAILVVALLAQVLMNIGIAGFQLVRSEGLRLAFVWPILLRMSTLSLCYTIPVSLLFAVTLGVGRMVADREITALRSSGVSHFQVMTPMLLIALACVMLMQYLNGEVLPPIQFERRNLTKVFLKQLKNLGYGGERTITLSKGMGEIRCGKYSGNTLEDVLISLWDIGRFTGAEQPGESTRQRLPVRIRAARAVVESDLDDEGQERLVIELFDADITLPDDVLRGGKGDSYFLQQLAVGRYRLPISLSDVNARSRDKRTSVLKAELAKNEAEVLRVDDELKSEKDLEAIKRLEQQAGSLRADIAEVRGEISRRRAFAFSCFTFLWVGIPLTLWLNSKNRLVPFFFGNVMAIGGFYPLVTLGLLLSEKGYPPSLAIQTGNIVLLIVGGMILWRLSRT